IALHGLGGSGKTQIALEFVYQQASERDCDVFWVHGGGVQKFREGFTAIAQHVRIPLASAETDQEGFLLNIKRWFEGSASGDWILVIDNADNEEDFTGNSGPISKFVPQGPRGNLIFTTRSLRVASWQGCERLDIGKMEEDEARALFLRRFDSPDGLNEEEEKEAITRILESVHHIPLAIVGAAAFMTETQTPPSTYWAIFQESDERAKSLLSQPFWDIQREADITDSTLATYFVTFDQITRQLPLAANLLRLIVCFDRQNIPEQLLTQSGLEEIDDPIQYRQAIGTLLGFSLVTAAKFEDKTFYELHRLVQLALQVYLPTEELKLWRATALKAVSRLFLPDENTGRYLGSAYIPHAIVVTKDSTDPISEEICFRLGYYFDEIGKYAESEAIHRRGLEGRERILGPNHPDTLGSVNNLAITLRRQGKYHESETMHRRALEQRERILGPDHPDTLSSVGGLASALAEEGKYAESETMHRHALEGRGRILGPDHPATLRSVNNLANVLGDQGKYVESETMNRCALEGRERVLGPDHPDTLSSVGNLAITLSDQGQY
ncbi:unnamed protein product, partial [Tuber aestivum]